MNSFIGKEAEGPNQMISTLFVPNTTQTPSIEKIERIIKEYAIESVYFGAGNKRGMPLHLLPDLTRLPRDLTCIIECDTMSQVAELAKDKAVLDRHFKRVQILFVLPVEDTSFFRYVTDIKLIDDKQLIWIPVYSWFETKLNDLRYSEDKEI
jgi:hypothetical protein